MITELIFHIAVLFMAMFVFFGVNITAPNAIVQFLLTVLSKTGSLFCLGYSLVQLFKHFQII